MIYHTLLFCDLDGTLISRYQPLSTDNIQMIERLNRSGTGIIAASGRSPALLRAVLPPDLPLAAAITSTGTGILDWKSQNFLLKRELSASQIRNAVQLLCNRKCNFMVQNPLPDNHLGKYFCGQPAELGRLDFFRRMQHTPNAYTELKTDHIPGQAAQLLAVFDQHEITTVQNIQKDLEKNFSVVRATSPIDHRSIWLEIFAPKVNKASAAQWLKQKIAPDARCLALGNDYNDCDLLDWADSARMAKTAPAELMRRYGALNARPEQILAEASEIWHLL